MRKRTEGFTLLELSVALTIFVFGIMGIVALSVNHSRQLKSIESRFTGDAPLYFKQHPSRWARQFGVPAIVSEDPCPLGGSTWGLPAYELELTSFLHDLNTGQILLTVEAEEMD